MRADIFGYLRGIEDHQEPHRILSLSKGRRMAAWVLLFVSGAAEGPQLDVGNTIWAAKSTEGSRGRERTHAETKMSLTLYPS
ncbi:hypothetical protein [Hoeflea sp.]|uniref:hypothetical protein n=1 Tax=Hoeflea sp. TaxID=1940281 RepID=UPI003A94AA6F